MTRAINYIAVGGFTVCALLILSMGCGNDAGIIAKVNAPADASATVPSGTTTIWELPFQVVTTDQAANTVPMNGVKVDVGAIGGTLIGTIPDKTDKMGVAKVFFQLTLPIGAATADGDVTVIVSGGNGATWHGTLSASQ